MAFEPIPAQAASSTVSIINTTDNTVSDFAVVGNPRGLAISPDGSRLYVSKRDVDRLEVFDTTTNPPRSVAEVATGNDPNGMAINASGSRLLGGQPV